MIDDLSKRIGRALNDVKKIQTLFKWKYGEECPADKEIEEVLKIAKTEHEEIQQYRAIGTVEQLEDMKQNYAEALSDWRQYRKIGTVEECWSVMERQNAKKPIKKKFTPNGSLLDSCPYCGAYLSKRKFRHCSYCGQAIDWKGKE